MKALGQEVIRKVTNLKNCCDNVKEEYGLSMVDKYFDEKSNPSIKKYKSVVGEYYRKYKSEIPYETSTTSNDIKENIKKFLNKTSGSFSG